VQHSHHVAPNLNYRAAFRSNVRWDRGPIIYRSSEGIRRVGTVVLRIAKGSFVPGGFTDKPDFRPTENMEYCATTIGVLRLDVRRPDHVAVAPLRDFLGDEFAKFGGRHRHAAEIGRTRAIVHLIMENTRSRLGARSSLLLQR
jgi:hypothetical protein